MLIDNLNAFESADDTNEKLLALDQITEFRQLELFIFLNFNSSVLLTAALTRGITLCVTVKQIKSIYYLTDFGSELESNAVDKWLSLTQGQTQLNEVLRTAGLSSIK
jgi:hypothetical protein